MMKNRILNKKINDLPYWVKAFLLNFIIAAIVIIPYIIKGHGYFSLSNDFIAETIPYGMFINNAYKSGEFLWNFNIDLGSNFLESLNGYNSSPFVLLQLLFPSEMFPKVIGWIIPIKYAVAGMTSSLYLKKYIKKENILLIGTMLYAFSSYNCGTIVFQFQDVVAVFPLMLYSLDILVEKGKMLPFIFATFLSALVGIVGFVSTTLFVIIYYFVRYPIPRIKEHSQIIHYIKTTFQCLIGGGIGALLTGTIMIPVVVNLSGNSRAASKLGFFDWFTISTFELLKSIKSFFLPAEPMNYSFSITGSDWTSNYAYLPLFGCSLVIAYLMSTKGKDWLKRILITLFLFTLLPVLNSLFYLFSSGAYRRWYHMLLLLMVLATTRVLEEPKEYKVKKGIRISIITIVLFGLICALSGTDSKLGFPIINEKLWFCYSIIYSLIGLVLVLSCTRKLMNVKVNSNHVILTVSIFCILQLGGTIHCYQSYVDNSGKDFTEYSLPYSESIVHYVADISKELERDIGPYRYYFDEGIGYTYYNIGMTNNLPTINSFISTLSNSIVDFYDELGVGRGTMTIKGPEGTLSLLGVKHIISDNVYYDYPIIEQIQNENGQNFNVFENPYSLPIGIVYNSYMKKSEFNSIENDKRAIAMLHSLVVDDNDEYKVINKLQHYTCTDSNELNADTLKSIVVEKQSVSNGTFVKGRNFFTSEIESNGNNYIFYSIPYEKWWKATVNGNPVDILNINGLMAVELKDGNNFIHFEYDYLPFKIGVAMSICGLICVLLVGIIEYKKTNKQ